MKSLQWLSLGLIVLFLGCNVSVNKSVDVPDGSKTHHGYTSVNGSIRIGSDCAIRGVCRSVNGSIEVGSRSTVRKVQSVNGGIRIMEWAKIREAVEAVNGGVEMEQGTEAADVKTVNGPVSLDSAAVTGDITTYNGNIALDNGSVVKGDIRIKQRKHGRHEGGRDEDQKLIIEIMNRSLVEGDILVSDPDQKVDVTISGGGKVRGKIERANVIQR
jgi:DUF4097 and DUF4098 domain-containing protein YvlB